MKLFCKDENGNIIELKQVQSIGEGDIIIKLNVPMRTDDIKEMEKELTKKFDRKVIILDVIFGDICVVPPKK